MAGVARVTTENFIRPSLAWLEGPRILLPHFSNPNDSSPMRAFSSMLTEFSDKCELEFS